jgi:hypothetical protein
METNNSSAMTWTSSLSALGCPISMHTFLRQTRANPAPNPAIEYGFWLPLMYQRTVPAKSRMTRQWKARRSLSQKPGFADGSRGGLLRVSKIRVRSEMPGLYELHQVILVASSESTLIIGRAYVLVGMIALPMLTTRGWAVSWPHCPGTISIGKNIVESSSESSSAMMKSVVTCHPGVLLGPGRMRSRGSG